MSARGERSAVTQLAVLAALTCVTAYFSYAYFHIDEYFQILELVRFRNGDIGEPLPWEAVERLRPWLQPAIYFGLVQALGIHDAFSIAFVARLVTGLANVGAIALLMRTTRPWLADGEARRRHVRVLTLLGFLPYLFVRTSSESASMAALTAGFACLLAGAEERDGRWSLALTLGRSRSPSPETSSNLPTRAAPLRAVLGGFLLGCAFEFRFQTAFASAGLVAWLAWRSPRALAPVIAGGLAALGVGALADRWGYGVWTFPAWTYFQANILEGAAGTFGTDPPFAYVWMSPANLFAPVVVVFMAVVVLAWKRNLRHPLTAVTLPFVLVHCLIAHKEERFLFPIVPLAAALVAFARVSVPRWAERALAVWSTAGLVLLAFVPLGWHTNVRFSRYVLEHVGDDFHAIATPEINLNLPSFRPRVYDVQKAPAAEIARRLDAGELDAARTWLVMDRPDFRDAPELEGKATLVFSELPFALDGDLRAREMRWIDAYNARARGPLRRLYYRSLFRLER